MRQPIAACVLRPKTAGARAGRARVGMLTLMARQVSTSSTHSVQPIMCISKASSVLLIEAIGHVNGGCLLSFE